MFINIDLKLLDSNKLNINEFITILKIYNLSRGDDINFSIHENDINSLIEKGFLIKKDNIFFITDKAKQKFKLTSIEDDITEVLNYFKELTGKNKIDIFSPTNRRFVRERLSKYTKEDLKNVINLKYNEWKDKPIMFKYIRIETLFNQEKFQKYVNELNSVEFTLNSNNNFKRI